MDLGTLATMAMGAITPHLSGLLAKAGEKAAEKAGEEGYDRAKSLVRAIWPGGESDLITLGLADAPDDEDALAELKIKIKRLLKANDALAAQVEKLLADTKPVGGVQQTVTGNSNVVIGGNVNSSTIIGGSTINLK